MLTKFSGGNMWNYRIVKIGNIKGEQVLSPFGDGNWDANIIHNDG